VVPDELGAGFREDGVTLAGILAVEGLHGHFSRGMGLVLAPEDCIVLGDGVAFYMVDSVFYSGINQRNNGCGVRLLGCNCRGSEPNQGKNSRNRLRCAQLSAIHHAKALRNPSIYRLC
jgi:hypothetical protein